MNKLPTLPIRKKTVLLLTAGVLCLSSAQHSLAQFKLNFQGDTKIFPASMCNYATDSKLVDYSYGSLMYPQYWPKKEYVRCHVPRDRIVLYPIELFVYVNDKSINSNFKCEAKSATTAGGLYHVVTKFSSGTGIQKLSLKGLQVPAYGAITVNCWVPSSYSRLVSYGIVEVFGAD